MRLVGFVVVSPTWDVFMANESCLCIIFTRVPCESSEAFQATLSGAPCVSQGNTHSIHHLSLNVLFRLSDQSIVVGADRRSGLVSSRQHFLLHTALVDRASVWLDLFTEGWELY